MDGRRWTARSQDLVRMADLLENVRKLLVFFWICWRFKSFLRISKVMLWISLNLNFHPLALSRSHENLWALQLRICIILFLRADNSLRYYNTWGRMPPTQTTVAAKSHHYSSNNWQWNPRFQFLLLMAHFLGRKSSENYMQLRTIR